MSTRAKTSQIILPGGDARARCHLAHQQPAAGSRAVSGVALHSGRRAAGRFADENGTRGNRPHTPAPLKADCLEIFGTGHSLLATLGYPLFDAVAKPAPEPAANETVYCKAGGANGRGLFTPEGFVVLRGSTGCSTVAPHLVGTSYESMRGSLREVGVLWEDGDQIVFVKDHLFRTPSGAAITLLGRTANGWDEWKSQDGQTLDALKRQSVAG